VVTGWHKNLMLFYLSYGDMGDILDKATENLRKYADNKEEIYIFGFSRGAAIARMFAAKISIEMDVKVKFLGVFDTVSATRDSFDLNPNTYPASGIIFEAGIIGAHIEEAACLILPWSSCSISLGINGMYSPLEK